MEAVKMIRSLYFAMVMVFFMNASGFASDRAFQRIDAGRVLEMQKQAADLWLIDIRGRHAFEERHIEGSVNIPAESLSHKKVPLTKVVVVIDDSPGQMGAYDAADELLKKGVKRVYVLEGGIYAWQAGGHPVTGKAPYRIRSITSDEYRKAISRNVPLRIFDMRSGASAGADIISGSEKIEGKDTAEKVMRLSGLLNAEDTEGLHAGLTGGKTIVLLFSASDDAEKLIEKNFPGTKKDIRYLIGGYETITAARNGNKTGSGKTCPKQ